MGNDWDNLRYLLALGRSKSIALAARQLEVSEITVRRRIAAMEEAYACLLFERVDQSFELTHAGNQLFDAAMKMESAAELGWDKITGLDGKPHGLVRVGAPDGLGTYRIAPALATLQADLPDLFIDLLTLPREADFSRREVDVAIVPSRPTGGGDHRIRSVSPVTVNLYAAGHYLDAHEPIRCIADLHKHRFIGYPSDSNFREPMNDMMREIGIGTRPVFSSRNILVQAQATARGAGVALLPDYANQPGLGLRRILPDDVTSKVPLWLIVHKEMYSLPRIRAVAKAIVRALAHADPTG